MNLPEAINEAIKGHGLIPNGAKVVAGVSGGSDSTALLRAFHALHIPVTVAHLNHQLRGSESDADEEFVGQLAVELGFPIIVRSVDVGKMAKTSNLSIEMAARKARHDFFSEFEGASIALAHHADDQVETFLLKLARGAGTRGLGGMSYCQSLGGMRIIRPMLDVSRQHIVQWLEVNEFAWREDRSNLNGMFLRNRIRHMILPLLERELNPNLRESILRSMDILRYEDEWMNGLLEGVSPEDTVGMPLAARRRVLRNWLFENGVEEVDYSAVEKIIAQMEKGNGTTIYELRDRQRVIVEYGIPRFENSVTSSLPSGETQGCLPGIILTMESAMGWNKDHGKGVGILPAEASFDADRIGDSTIEVRSVMPGDRMEPWGMEGSRKLQDIFTDQKIPRSRRSHIPVVVCRGEIIWLPGYRIARGWEVRNEQGRSVHVRIEQLKG